MPMPSSDAVIDDASLARLADLLPVSGAGAALTDARLLAAIDAHRQRYGVKPYLLVPPPLSFQAAQILNAHMAVGWYDAADDVAYYATLEEAAASYEAPAHMRVVRDMADTSTWILAASLGDPTTWVKYGE